MRFLTRHGASQLSIPEQVFPFNIPGKRRWLSRGRAERAMPASADMGEQQEFPGLPTLLDQKRSKLTGKPIRVIKLPEVGLLGGGGGLLGLPHDSLVGATVLMLDDTNDISSVYMARDPGRLTNCYYDLAAALDPLLPREGTLGLLGLGGGTAAVMAHRYWPDREMEGWEYDPEVVEVARPHMGMAELEAAATGALAVQCGDAFCAKSRVKGGFAGLFVDLFATSHLLPELEQEETWRAWLAELRPGGRLLANLGGGDRDSELDVSKTNSSFTALALACDFEMSVLENAGGGMVRNMMVLTGPPPDEVAWEKALPKELGHLARGWVDPNQ